MARGIFRQASEFTGIVNSNSFEIIVSAESVSTPVLLARKLPAGSATVVKYEKFVHKTRGKA